MQVCERLPLEICHISQPPNLLHPLNPKSALLMQPDGHCMYRAVQDQLSLRSNGDSHPAQDVAELRKKTADYMRHHQDDFLPFLTQVCTQCTSPTA